jgi:hypothetical protein
MKTAMQQLLEEVTEEMDGSTSVEFVAALGFVKSAIEQDYLEKEKWQIMNAYDIGWLDCKNSGGKELNDQYYFETFNANEE